MITEQQLLEDAKRLTRVFFARYGVESHDKDDLAQEITIALWRASQTYDSNKGSWDYYSYKKVFYAVRTYYRDAPAIGRQYYRQGHERFDPFPYEELLHEESTEDSYTAVELEEGLEPFNLHERQLIVLIMMGYSITDAASILDMSIGMANRTIAFLRIKNSSSYYSHHTDLPQLRQAA